MQFGPEKTFDRIRSLDQTKALKLLRLMRLSRIDFACARKIPLPTQRNPKGDEKKNIAHNVR